ncbi:MAG: nucleotidyltransferase family protein [Nanoarchaeota archaeon]|nr:nucleotidyltransferase family protein [Nanoarchaeota archaeon]
MVVKIRVLLLAAGYATRLYPLTENTPKPLLKVGEKTILNHILDKLEEVENVKEVYVVTNDKFYPAFTSWVKNIKTPFKLKILNDGTKSNEDRLGAIGDIQFAVQQENINEDLLVIAGDNLFGFSLLAFTDFFKNKNSSVVAFHDLKDKNKVKGKYGVGIVEGSKVIDFEEKPAEPKSSLASTACYFFKRDDLRHIRNLVKTRKVDAPGNLIRYLAEQSEVHGFVFDEHWFDVGTFESLEEAKKVYER